MLTRAILVLFTVLSLSASDLETARDAQDRGTIQELANHQQAAAQKQPQNADAQYQAALAQSYLAEVAIELGDKNGARSAAEAGIPFAEKAVTLKQGSSEYHRMLGTLCGQLIPANVLAGINHAKCAEDEVNKAIQLDPKSALAFVSHGVGNYYLPPAFGGGVDKAIADFQKAIQLDEKLADAYLWLGIAQRKAGRNAEARKALERAQALNPARAWVKQQLAKTP